MNNIKNISALLLLFLSSLLVAQNKVELISYKGIVIDVSGQAIEGALVFANKSKHQTITQLDGRFELQIQAVDYINTICEGYEAQACVYGVGSDTIVMKRLGELSSQQELTLSQGRLPFERITGAVEYISGDELLDYPTSYLQEALAGRLSGVKSDYSRNSPIEEDFTTSIRGGEGEVYIDGALSEITETALEVDEIIVAKDYASSLLYGSSATNGAMIINTRRGKPGQKLMNFGVKTGMRNPVMVPDMMTSAQYATAYNTALQQEGLDPIYSDAAIAAYANGSDPVRYPNNDYYNDLMSSASKYLHVTSDLSGGNDVANYYSHVGYYGTNGMESEGKGTQLKRLRTKNNVDVNIGDFAKVNLGIGARYEIKSGSSLYGSSLFENRLNTPANAYPYMINDSVYGKSLEYDGNLYADMKYGTSYEQTKRDVYSRVGVEVDLDELTEGLTLDVMYNIYVYNTLTQVLEPSVDMAEPYYVPSATGSDSLVLRNYSYGEDDSKFRKSSDYVNRNQYLNLALNYNREFNENSALIAALQYTSRNETGSNLSQDDMRRNIGFSANYMSMKKYIAEVSVMNSAIRQMNKAERQRLSYSAGLAWLLHKEDFLSSVAWLDMLKLRANYGVQTMPINYFYLNDDLYDTAGAGKFGIDGKGGAANGYVRSFTASPDIKLPQRSYLSVGGDFRMFNNKISGQVNYFSQVTSDYIVNPTNLYPIISSDTAYLSLINYGESKKSGIDARVKFQQKWGDFRLVADVNMMYYTTYVSRSNAVDYPELERNINGNVGMRILGLDADGIFQSQAEIDAAKPQVFGDLKPGDIRYKDFNNDGVINEKDIHEIGKYPPLNYGLNLALSYKGFTLSAHADGVAGGEYVDNIHWRSGISNYPASMQNNWANNKDMPRISPLSGAYNNHRASTLWLRNASYFNLRNVNLVYHIPPKVLSAIAIKDLSIRLSGKNLLVLSDNSEDVYMPYRNGGYAQHPVMNAYELGFDIKF